MIVKVYAVNNALIPHTSVTGKLFSPAPFLQPSEDSNKSQTKLNFKMSQEISKA